MTYLAHSARPEKDIPAQSYKDHVCKCRCLAKSYAKAVARYSPVYGPTLVATASLAGEFHDLGKLDDKNQDVLSGKVFKRKLPVNHVDAGTAHLLKQKTQESMYAALICYSHHLGLPSMPKERNRSEQWMRDWRPECRKHTDRKLGDYLKKHHECIETWDALIPKSIETNRLQLFWRLALACQVDADHGDTANHYGKGTSTPSILLRPAERLIALNTYVQGLSNKNKHESRTEIRQSIYQSCREADTCPSFYACDAPVGSGKTTAVMAHLLKTAIDKKLRRVFVVLPFTNIISQSVDDYRKALVLKDENPEEVIAEHHHKADYSAPDSRQFATLWKAPIVVTTAVQFFETLASNMPAELRKLHSLPGSAIFFDEAHAALPTHLWPQAWEWLNQLSKDWGSYFVFGSGSLTRFWELSDFHPQETVPPNNPPFLPDLVPQTPRIDSRHFEKKRINYQKQDVPMSLDKLTEWVLQFKEGPRLLILNTVQSAAVVARELEKQCGRERIEHLSTALTPKDREETLKRIKTRLKNNQHDTDWTLVATSCVEAGMNFSFRTGFRERAGLVNLIQIGGRVNRNNEWNSATVWDFQIIPGQLLRLHPQFKTAARVLGELFAEDKVSLEHCKEALKREIRWEEDKEKKELLLKAESSQDAKNTDFPLVSELFRVIDNKTVTVVIDTNLQEQLKRGIRCGRAELQKNSVQIWGWKAEELALKEFNHFSGVYGWPRPYDTFLGYMAGLLKVIDFNEGASTVL